MPARLPMTGVLVAVNVAVYLLWRTIGRSPAGAEWLAANFLLGTAAIARGRVWTLLLAEVSHIDTGHLLFNMIALWTFGRAVERAIGPWRLLHLYVVGSLLASLAYVAYAIAVRSPAPSLGASGAVSAIAVVFTCLYPRAWLVLNFFIPVPAVLGVALFLALDLMGVLNPLRDKVAHAAHLGGALYGFVYWLVALRPRWRRG
jgi:membrane associated rhomboid family serine protease